MTVLKGMSGFQFVTDAEFWTGKRWLDPAIFRNRNKFTAVRIGFAWQAMAFLRRSNFGV